MGVAFVKALCARSSTPYSEILATPLRSSDMDQEYRWGADIEIFTLVHTYCKPPLYHMMWKQRHGGDMLPII